VKTNLLLGAAAVGVLITGAVAQTTQRVERIKDAAGHSQAVGGRSDETPKSGAAHNADGTNQQAQNSDAPRRNVRTVYPNTQNAEQAVRESRNARGQADASQRQPGDVTPVSNAQPAATPATASAPSLQSSQHSAQTPGVPQSAPASSTAQSTPAPITQTTQSASPQATGSAQPASPPPSTGQPMSTVTAAQTSTPLQPTLTQSSQASSSTSVIALGMQQQMSIGQTIAQRGVKPLTNVNFSIAVGTKVPTAVQLRALPSDLATFIPQYRGYSYVAVEEQIVIVDPGTHEIVAIVPYTAATPAARMVETPPATQEAPPATHVVETPKVSETKAAHVSKTKPARAIAQKPMVSRSVNLHTEEKPAQRHHASEQRKKTTVRSVVRQDSRDSERAPRRVTIEESSEPARVPVLRSPSYDDDDDAGYVPAPRQNGFFGFFR
jgi:hypothetical protein